MLPEGWQHLCLGDVFNFKNGLNGEKSLYGAGAKFVNVMDVFRGPRLRHSEIVGEMAVSPRQLAEFAVRQGDVLFNRTSETDDEIALSTVYLDTAPAVFGGFVIRARPNGKALDQDFCIYGLQADSIRREMIRRGQGAIRSNIGQADLATVPILLPPLPEQRKIAEILSTWDAAIAAQERLIANAKRQKKALMQTLLPTGAHTPKKRLPGFSGDWRSVCLGDIGKLRKGKGIRRDQVRESGFPCVRYGEIYTQHHEQVRQFHSFIDAETAAESEPISAGDILFTCSGETAEEIGKCVAYLGSEKAYAGGDIIILSPTADNASFLGYVLNDTEVAEQKRRFGQGNSVVHISAANLSKLTFKLPSRAEQDAITSVLDDATIHIDGLAAELTTLIQEKSALMQQLLTGKRRVKLEEAA